MKNAFSLSVFTKNIAMEAVFKIQYNGALRMHVLRAFQQKYETLYVSAAGTREKNLEELSENCKKLEVN